MISSRALQNAYVYFSSKRVWLYGATGAFLFLCIILFLMAPIRTDILVMLPEGRNGALLRDFELLAESGLSNNVFISLQAGDDASRNDLINGAKTMAQELPPTHFALVDATTINPFQIMDFVLSNAPNLMTEADVQRLETFLGPEAVQVRLADAYHELMTPQGMAMKSLIRRDPLAFRTILLPRLQSFKALSEVTVSDGYLFNGDQTCILLTGKSDVALTDAQGAAQLLAEFEQAKAKLPLNVTAELIGGHVHTNANATVIKQDIIIISMAALGAIGLLFLIFFRSSQVVGVFLTPLVAMCAALGAIAFFSDAISAIVIGFGSVLIGISIDFSMHVYFGIARHPGSPGEAVQAIFKPILFCALTSCAAFGALYLSGIPGINQLATFSIAGLVVSALFSLFVLPHMARKATVVSQKSDNAKALHQRPVVVYVLLAGLLVGSVWIGSSVQLDPDLRSIEYVPQAVRDAEQRFNSTWGDTRGKAVVFAQGESLEAALHKSERVEDLLAADLPEVKAVSLSPLFPSFETQQSNRQRWAEIWADGRRDQVVQQVGEAGRAFGFSKRAFQPFETYLAHAPDAITPVELREASLGFLVDMLMPTAQSGKNVLLTLLPDSDAVQAAFSEKVEEELGVRLVSNSRLKSTLESAMKDDIKYFISISALAVMLLVIVLFRDIRRSCLAMLPAVVGLAMVFAVLAATNTPLNLFHITALPLVIGLGTDYGIFLVSREAQRLDLATIAAVKASGLTTLASFGILILARHPSLHSLGVTVVVGVGSALFCAVYLMPHIVREES